jgi:hypothetical protein
MGRTHDVMISEFDLDRLESQIITVEEQRDTLAEALRELCKALLKDKPMDITELLNKAGDALNAVKGGSDERR